MTTHEQSELIYSQNTQVSNQQLTGGSPNPGAAALSALHFSIFTLAGWLANKLTKKVVFAS